MYDRETWRSCDPLKHTLIGVQQRDVAVTEALAFKPRFPSSKHSYPRPCGHKTSSCVGLRCGDGAIWINILISIDKFIQKKNSAVSSVQPLEQTIQIYDEKSHPYTLSHTLTLTLPPWPYTQYSITHHASARLTHTWAYTHSHTHTHTHTHISPFSRLIGNATETN